MCSLLRPRVCVRLRLSLWVGWLSLLTIAYRLQQAADPYCDRPYSMGGSAGEECAACASSERWDIRDRPDGDENGGDGGHRLGVLSREKR